jgi:hypothetical protein
MSGCFEPAFIAASLNRPGDLAPAATGANRRAVRACTTMPAVPAPILRGTSSLSLRARGSPSAVRTSQAAVRQLSVCRFSCRWKGHRPTTKDVPIGLGSDRGSLNHWEHAVVEAGDAADPIAGEGEDEEAGPVGGSRYRRVGRPRTPADRWLASGRRQTLGPSGKCWRTGEPRRRGLGIRGESVAWRSTWGRVALGQWSGPSKALSSGRNRALDEADLAIQLVSIGHELGTDLA